MTDPRRPTLAVVGGGISGLTAAWVAAGAGYDVTLLEASLRLGGVIRTESVGGVRLDVGAESLLTSRPEAVDLIDELGLSGERIAPTTVGARVRAGGHAHPLPARTVMGIPSDPAAVRASGALSETALAALADEPTLPPLPPLTDDVAVGELVRGRLGDEVVDRLVDPLLGGVYSGRADTLSLRATVPRLADALAAGGSLLHAAASVAGAGTRAPGAGSIFTSLRGGLDRLPQALAASGRFAVRTSATVRELARTPRGWALTVGAVPVAERLEVDAVVLAVPAPKAARLLRTVVRAAATELAAVDTASSAIVALAFDRAVEVPPGSGLLVGSRERFAVKAITLSTAKWPLTTDGQLVLRASVGRAGETEALRLPDDELVRLVRHELRPLIGVTAEPVDALVTRWGGGLPQYAVGHLERVSRLRAAVAEHPGLAVCGSALDGVGVPACIAAARRAVADLGTAGASGPGPRTAG